MTPEERARLAGRKAQGIDSLVRRIVARRDELGPGHRAALRLVVEEVPLGPDQMELLRVLWPGRNAS